MAETPQSEARPPRQKEHFGALPGPPAHGAVLWARALEQGDLGCRFAQGAVGKHLRWSSAPAG
eukprot:13818755-Alexandrium_andersonii.AAC.1